MTIELYTPDVDALSDVVRALRSWQREDAPIQLHPGDLGWSWRTGAAGLAAALRIWSRDGAIVALGLVDGPGMFRMTVAPQTWHEESLARRVVADLSDPRQGVLPSGKADVEVPDGTRVKALLSAGSWRDSEPWTPLRMDLGQPVNEPDDVRVEVVRSAEQIDESISVHQSAWASAQFSSARWRTMAAGVPYADARCLLARNSAGTAVATVTVWSAGPGKPALVEPLGVHVDHRRRGYGAAICVAAAAHLRLMGCSSVLVCTPSSLVSAVATYESAGFQRLPERLDRSRDR